MKRHLYVYVLIGITSYAIRPSAQDEEVWRMSNLKLIIPGHVIERYGVVRKPSLLLESTDPGESKRIKNEICQNIFTTPYFAKLDQQWINPEQRNTREFLQNHYPDIYYSLFKEYKNRSRWIPIYRSNFEYENAYKVRGTYIGIKTMDSHPMVFTCLVQQISSDTIEEYFVSQPYYLSIPAFEIVDIPGRFIFSIEGRFLWLEAFATDSTKMEYKMDANNPNGFDDLANFRSVQYNDVED